MAYIGNSPGVSSQRSVTKITATAGQTVFTSTSGYVVGCIEVFQNGVYLDDGVDFTATDGVSVTFTVGALAGDSITLVAFLPRGLSDGYTKPEADAKYVALTGNQTIAGTKTFSSDASISGLTVGKGYGSINTNTALGIGVLASSSLSGSYNVGVGQNALPVNTSGQQNTAVGWQAGASNTTGGLNCFFGTNSASSNTTGSYNVALGVSALSYNTTASNNTAVGYQAGFNNTTSGNNVYFGYQAGYSQVSGDVNAQNTYLGWKAGYSHTGYTGTFVGGSAGKNATTGNYNAFFGYSAGFDVTTGAKNTIIGGYSGNQGGLDIRTANNYIVLSDGDGNPRQVIDGSGNVGIGTVTPSGYGKLSVYGNIIFGPYTRNQAGLQSIGWMTSNDPADDSRCSIGFGATAGAASSSSYISFSTNLYGTSAGERMRLDSSGNLLIGKTSYSSTTNGFQFGPADNGANVGLFSITGNSTNAGATALQLYSTSNSTFRFYVNYAGTIFAQSTTISGISDQRLKENIRDLDDGLDTIMALKPRKFDWKEGKGADTQNVRGFIAQEFKTVLPDLVDEWKDPAPEGEEPYQSVRADLIPVLVKAIQEQQTLITDLQARLTALEGNN